jgi:hypothetical protein
MTALVSRPVRRSLLAPACLLSLIAFVHVEAASAAATVSWQVFTMAEPTRFSPADSLSCEAEGKCDQYDALVLNAGDAPSTGTVTVTDTLPSGMTARGLPFGRFTEEAPLECTGEGQQLVTCTFEVSVPPGAYFEISVPVSAPGSSMSGSLSNAVTVSGGGAATPAGSSLETPIDSHSPEFALQAFRFSALRADGTPELQAGAHPGQLTSVFAHPVLFSTLTAEAPFAPAANPKDVVVELPPGLVGDPQVVARCSQTQLRRNTCPPSSRIGAVAFAGARLTGFTFTESTSSLPVSALYNMTPEAGYPAEFAFQLGGIPVYLYASVVHGASGYHLRIADPGVPTELGIFAVAATFYGQPGRLNGDGNAEAFLTNPTDCAASMQASRIEVDAWEQPGLAHEAEQTVYPALTGCEGLRFEPTLAFAPRAAPEGTTQADTPSGYDFDLEVPRTSQYGERATPEPRDVSVEPGGQ